MRKLYVLFLSFPHRYKNMNVLCYFLYELRPKKSINPLTEHQLLVGEYEIIRDALLRMLTHLCYQLLLPVRLEFLL